MRAGQALPDLHIAVDVVKTEPLLVDIAEIERQTAWQRLQIEHTEQTSRPSGIGLQELAAADVEPQLTTELRHGERRGRAWPAELAVDLSASTAQRAHPAQLVQPLSAVGHLQPEVEVACARVGGTGGFPATGRAEPGLGVCQGQLPELPCAAVIVRGPLQHEPAERPPCMDQFVDDKVERWQGIGRAHGRRRRKAPGGQRIG